MANETEPPAIDSNEVGVVWPATHPGADPVLYGQVDLQPKGCFEVRSLHQFTLTYTVGRYGLDDTGSIRVVFRFFGDWGALQTTDPTRHGYVSAHTSGSGRIELDFSRTGHQRPYFQSLTARLFGGYLSEGDTITIVFGDTSKGSPGMKLQTFSESTFEFKVLADVCAVGHYIPLSETPAISISPGAPSVWRAVLPTLRRPGETFQLGIKAEDKWGNPTDRAHAHLRLEPTLPVVGLPDVVEYLLGQKSMVFENLIVDDEGLLNVMVYDGDDLLAEAGPLVIRQGVHAGYWGDLHGQSGETIGINTAREYFDFARNKSFLDVTGHQANDFQINNAFWRHINELTLEYHEDHRFVTFPGYEWSGNTGVGGDRNVYFRTEGRPIRRSSHALITDRSDIHTDAPNARALFEALKNEDCVVFAHVGGRYADVSYAHDPATETAMEIHSAWGTFEWLLTDGFELGHRCGVVCNSDGHKGRPGASYPGAASFGAYGGLTCFLTDQLTRDAVFDCLRRRHHYGTSGCRLHLDVHARFSNDAVVFDRDPNVFPDTESRSVREVMMGDIVQAEDEAIDLNIGVVAGSPIERIDIRNGIENVACRRPYGKNELGSRIRVIWSGAEYRGRGRQTTWLGRATFRGHTIERFAKINAWNHERRLEQTASDTIEWDAMTTGNYGGFDVWLSGQTGGELDLVSNHGSLRSALDDIGFDDIAVDGGGLGRELTVFRLPDANPVRRMEETIRVPLKPDDDNPIWVRVTTEDGHRAWSSPIFVFRPTPG